MISKLYRITLLAVMLSIQSWAEGPSEPGGGSVYIQLEQKPILLDFVLGGVFQDPSQPQVLMIETPFLKKLHFEFFDLKKSQLQINTLNAIENLKDFPKFQSIMKLALDDLKLIYTFHSIKKIDNIFIPEVLTEKSNKIKTVILYDTHFGGITDANLFNQMGFVSQTGLIFHEVLRKLQLAYKIRVSDEEIQQMTYYAFKDQLDSQNNEVINKAVNAYSRIEATLSGESPEMILINNTRNWICFEFIKHSIPENSHSFCKISDLSKQKSRHSMNEISFKSPVEIYGDMVVEVDSKRSRYNQVAALRKIIDDLRDLVDLQMFPNDVFGGWMTWNNFPDKGKKEYFGVLSLYLNNPEQYRKSYEINNTEYNARLKQDYQDASNDLGDKALKYLKKNYFSH